MSSGAALAVLAALSFGVTTPIVARYQVGTGPFTTAALLYAGASVSAVVIGRASKPSGGALDKSTLPRLLAVALVGAGLAPVLLAWGLARSGGTNGSLLLNLEAVFTVLIARIAYREPIGRRVAWALALMAFGGLLLGVGARGSAEGGSASFVGGLAVAGATALWAIDNALSRGLAERDPVSVVAAKGALGATLTGAVALAVAEPRPGLAGALALLACGGTGYGLSLRLYLLAQRRVGAARTGSIFAIAPFVGAAVGWAMGEGAPTATTSAAALLFGGGLWLHWTERHGHRHRHDAIEHVHAHRHDDGHHDHAHHPAFEGEHTHPHRHDALEHDHEHAPDLHHAHAHDT